MNAKRRKKLVALISDLQGIVGQIGELKSSLETPMSEELEGFDNLPEGFQNSDKGERFLVVIHAMSDADTSLDESVSAIADAIDFLEEAAD